MHSRHGHVVSVEDLVDRRFLLEGAQIEVFPAARTADVDRFGAAVDLDVGEPCRPLPLLPDQTDDVSAELTLQLAANS